MPTTPAVFDNFQLEATDYRQFLTQAEQLSARGVPDPAAPVVRRLDMNTDGDGFDPEQRFSEKMADGLDAPLSVALVGDEGTFGGNLTARYRELRHDMPDLCGVDNLVSKTTLPDGRIKEVWRFPEGPRKIRTQSAWFGIKDKCWLLQYGKLITWVLESERTGETGGNKSYHFNAAVRNQQFPAFVAQNSKYTVTATAVSGNLVLSYLLPGSSTPRSITMAIGDTALQTKTKFESFGDGVLVNVVGTISAAAGKKHTVVGTGNTFTIYGDIVVNTATMGLSNLQTAIRAKAGRGSAIVSGSITPPVAGSDLTDTASIGKSVGMGRNDYGDDPSGTNGYNDIFFNNLVDGSDPAVQAGGYVGYLFNQNQTFNRLTANWSTNPLFQPTNFRIQSSANGTFNDAVTLYTNNTLQTTGVTAYDFPTTTARAVRIIFDDGHTVQVRELQIIGGGSVGAATLAIQYDVAAGSVGDIEAVPGTGYVGTTIPQGAAGGTPTIEFTAPANVRVPLTKTSGHAGYVLSETQFGQDGTGALEIGGPEIHPTHWLVYKGATKAELDAIDMGTATTPRDTTTTKLVKTAHGQTLSFENLSQGVYLEDGKVNPGTHVTRRPTVTSSLTVDVQQAGTVDYAEDIYATENFGGCGVDPFWLRYSARCLLDEIWIDGKWARNQTAAHPVVEGLAQWQFPLTRIRDRSGSLFITFIYPAS